jgi:hypothetical protein
MSDRIDRVDLRHCSEAALAETTLSAMSSSISMMRRLAAIFCKVEIKMKPR